MFVNVIVDILKVFICPTLDVSELSDEPEARDASAFPAATDESEALDASEEPVESEDPVESEAPDESEGSGFDLLLIFGKFALNSMTVRMPFW
jgi:hypothetical protein